jgi:purine-cytosine permease-like protein
MSTIVDTETIAKLVGASVAAGLGVTILFALAIAGITRFAEARRSESAAAAIYAMVAGIALLACLAAIVLGLVVMTQKS